MSEGVKNLRRMIISGRTAASAIRCSDWQVHRSIVQVPVEDQSDNERNDDENGSHGEMIPRERALAKQKKFVRYSAIVTST
mgnify:FL=1